MHSNSQHKGREVFDLQKGFRVLQHGHFCHTVNMHFFFDQRADKLSVFK